MPSATNIQLEHSLLLQFKKNSGKWTKRFIVLRKTSETSEKRGYLEVYRPYSSSITKRLIKLSTGSLSKLEVFPSSHVIIRNKGDKEFPWLGICSLKETKKNQSCYMFAADNEKELDDLMKLQHFIKDLCDIKSFEVSADIGSNNNSMSSLSALLHICEQKACLTTTTPPLQVLHEWSLAEQTAHFQWERHGFHIEDLNHPAQHCFLYTKSQDDIQDIKREIHNQSEKVKQMSRTHVVPSEQMVVSPTQQSPNICCDSSPTREWNEPELSIRRKSASSLPVKENVEIRFPDHTKRRCNSETLLQRSSREELKLFKCNSFDRKNDKNRTHELEMHFLPQAKTTSMEKEQKDMNVLQINANTKIISEVKKDDETLGKKMPDLRPKVYMYMNVISSGEQQISNTYVNIFSGSTFKGCYENWQQQSIIYSTIQEMLPPPVPPRQHPPKLPPRRHHQCYTSDFIQGPPPLPPKLKSPTTGNELPKVCSRSAPRIQVALFAGIPVSGRVWFLRVTFMHQDENDTTFKRVKDIEAYSNHRLVKTISLEVISDLTMKVNVNTEQGFLLLNGDQQNIDLSDIEDLRKGDWFVVEFHIQNSEQSHNHLTGHVSIDPNTTGSCRRSCRASMGIDEIFQRTVFDAYPVGRQHKQCLLSDYNKRQTLCRALDMTIHSHGHDWRQVAGSLGFTHAEILELQDKSMRSVQFSPTDEVLTMWEQRDPNCKLDKLVNILREIGRLDIVQDLGYSITLES